MCGIFGIVGDRRETERVELEPILAALRHRGPDGNGTWRSAGEPAAALAQTRLAVIDLSASASQPMSTEDGRWTIVYNGEVFNHPEIRTRLEDEGIAFRSDSDTEVVLRAFVRWGADALTRFRGMFAFAIWDGARRELFLARDRFGIKPLYWARRGSAFAFASEVRALVAAGMAPRRLSAEGLAGYLAFGSVAEPWTIVEGIRAFPPGSFGRTSGGDPSVSQYWRVPEVAADGPAPSAAEIRRVAADAVEMRLLSDVPLGIFLSGGMDSASIAALASRASREAVRAFTLGFDRPEEGEVEDAAAVAARFGCRHEVVRMDGARAAREVPEALDALDQPSADGINTYFVARAARASGLTVALSGLGGDEIFAGYPRFRSFARWRLAGRVLGALRADRWHRDRPAGDRSDRFEKVRALAAGRGDAGAAYAASRCVFTDGQRRGLQSDGAPRPAAGFVGPSEGADAVDVYTRFEIAGYLRNTLLRDADSMGMASSLEIRVPLLDHVLAETLLRIPGARKIDGRRQKPLLADAVPEIEALARHPKRGFVLPMDSWLQGPLSDWTADLLRSPEFDPLVPGAGDTLWRAFLGRPGRTGWSRVWCLAALRAWCRAHRMEPPASDAVPARRPAGRRALVLLSGAYGAHGGIERYNRSLLRAFGETLGAEGGRVEALILNDPPASVPEDGGVRRRGFGGSKVRFAAASAGAALRRRPDVVLVGHLNFAPLGGLLRVLRPGAARWIQLYGIESWKRAEFAGRPFVRSADRFLSISRFTAEAFAAANSADAARITVIPCPLDSEWAASGADRSCRSADPVMLAVSRLWRSEPYKGIDRVLRVLPEIAARIPDVRFVVVGDGDGRPGLVRLAETLGIAGRVEFRGHVPRPELERAYAESSLFVLPSSGEGFGIVYLEAGFFGLPAVASASGAAREVVSDGATGRLVGDGDAELRDAILDLLTRPEERVRMGRAARERVANVFGYERFREGIARLLASPSTRSVLGSERRASPESEWTA